MLYVRNSVFGWFYCNWFTQSLDCQLIMNELILCSSCQILCFIAVYNCRCYYSLHDILIINQHMIISSVPFLILKTISASSQSDELISISYCAFINILTVCDFYHKIYCCHKFWQFNISYNNSSFAGHPHHNYQSYHVIFMY